MNSLAVAVLERNILTSTTECVVDRAKTEMHNSTTGTIYLKKIQQESFIENKNKLVVVPNFKHFFPGVEMIGKYFKIRVILDSNGGKKKSRF